MPSIDIEGSEVKLSNVDKIFFPKHGLMKSDIIDYYIRLADRILPHLKDRPFTMINYPDGYGQKRYFRKQRPDDAPDFVETFTMPSEEKGQIDWCLVNNKATLVWMVNRSCIEMHSWTVRVPDIAHPDIAMIDLDPNGSAGFKEAVTVAKAYGAILKELDIKSYPKTSGATGIHICIPLAPKYTYDELKAFLAKISKPVQDSFPKITTTQRIINKRGNTILLDYLQNAPGKTLPPPYSLRVTENATVSAPLLWEELEDPKLSPDDFNLFNIENRISKVGDIAAQFLNLPQELTSL